MRLLQVGNRPDLSITRDVAEPPGPYAILSHTWYSDEEEEVTLEEVRNGSAVKKSGYAKLQFCANQANKDGLQYIWVDTCCIDRANLVELSEAITSMFRWYQQAKKCYVYLSDVSADCAEDGQDQGQWEDQFRRSRWFTRGWTLQELLAPASVKFFSQQKRLLGDKQSLEVLIHEITKIPVAALRGKSLSHFTVDERLRWSNTRFTRKVEDMAYCLLGIFDISMSLRYGEGEKALSRLQMKVKGSSKGAARSDLIAWLAPGRSMESHAKALSTRHPGTGSDFTAGPLFRWLKSDTSSGTLMWVTGKSGTGKTTLFSQIVEVVESYTSEGSAGAFAYHYCAFSDPESQLLVNILGAFVAQLSAWLPDILDEVTDTFQKDRSRKQDKTLSLWQLENILIKYVNMANNVVFLLDAINESEDLVQTSVSIVELLQRLPNLRVLVTSTTRAPSNIMGEGVVLTEVEMNTENDIKTFVDYQLSSHGVLSHISPESKERVRFTLVNKADHSFRWVSLTMNDLRTQRTGKAVLRALGKMPESLNSTYASMLNKIPDTDRTLAREALLWVCFAQRPLTLLELSEAAVLEESDTTLNQDSRLHNANVILDICHGFIERDNASGKVKLAHSSVRDYLLSDQIVHDGHAFFSCCVDDGNRSLMRKCLTYLMFDDLAIAPASDPVASSTRHQQFPLLDYAAQHWGLHASFATSKEWNLADTFFSTRSRLDGGSPHSAKLNSYQLTREQICQRHYDTLSHIVSQQLEDDNIFTFTSIIACEEYIEQILERKWSWHSLAKRNGHRPSALRRSFIRSIRFGFLRENKFTIEQESGNYDQANQGSLSDRRSGSPQDLCAIDPRILEVARTLKNLTTECLGRTSSAATRMS